MNHTRALVHGLVEIFQECSVEHDLLLYNKGLYDEDLEVLHKYLRKNRNVRVLRLKRNHFTKTGCPTMAAILNDPALCIRELDLSFNRIRSNGMKILAQALRTNTKLRVLSISGIGLGDNGAEYLGNALVENRSLVAMQLDSNTFLKEGRMRGKLRLADGISQNRQLTVVTLGGTCPERLNFARLLIARSGDPRVVLPYNSDKRLKRVIDFVIEHWTSAHKVSAPLVTLPVENLNRILDEFSRFGDDDFAGMEEELIEHLAIYLDDSAAKKRRKKKSLKRAKIVVVGNSGAGKTSLIKSLISRSSFLTSKNRGKSAPWMRVSSWNVDRIRCSIFNFGGEEEFNMVQSYFVSFSRAIILVAVNLAEYERTSEHYYQAVQMWINALHMHIPSGQFLIVGTHSDLIDPSVAEARATHIKEMFEANEERVARELEALILEKKQNERKSLFVRQWSMVDAESSRDDEVENYFCPTVLAQTENSGINVSLEGKKKSGGFRLRRTKVTTEYLEASLSQRPTLCAREVMIVTSEHQLEGMEDLREDLLNMLRHPVDHGLSVDLPSSYVKLSEAFDEYIKENETYMVEMEKLHQMFVKRSRLFNNQTKLERALELFHDTGRILWIRNNERLKDTVFLSPQWVAEVVQSVINRRMFSSEGSVLDTIEPDHKLDKETLRSLKVCFFEEGALDYRLLRRFPYWSRLSNVEFAKLLLLLKSFDLLCFMPRKFDGELAQLSSFIPFYLSSKKSPPRVPRELRELFKSTHYETAADLEKETTLEAATEAYGGSHVQYKYVFVEYYPAGLMQRLLVRIWPFVLVDLVEATKQIVKVRSMCGSSIFLEEDATDKSKGAQGVLTITVVKGEESNVWQTMNIVVGVLEEVLFTFPGLHVSVFVAFASRKHGAVVIPRAALERLQVRTIESKRVSTDALSFDHKGDEIQLSWVLPEVYSKTDAEGSIVIPQPIHLTRKCVNARLACMLANLQFQITRLTPEQQDERANIISTAFIEVFDSLLLHLCKQHGGSGVRGWDDCFEFLKKKQVPSITGIMRDTQALKLLQKYVLTTQRKGNFLSKLSIAIKHAQELLETVQPIEL